ncbi:MAG: repeat-containing protein [Armatimonadetes bacterium]|nr:repeat-containing protein [Armatimonadota bacterium]
MKYWTKLGRVAAAAGGLTLALTSGAQADVAAGRQALQQGQWTEAETEFKSGLAAEKGPATLGLGELYLTTGRYAEALEQATQASLIPTVKGPALCLAGEIYRETGKSADALKMFQAAITANPRELRARVYLGLTQLETGQEAVGEKTLDQFFQDFNAGKIDAKRADHLTYTAMAARGLKAWQDANGTFQDATEKDPAFQLANLEWGTRFLDKYNTQEATKCFQEVLKINRALPRALVGLANVRVEAAYDVAGATKLAEQALKSNPKYVPAFTLKARLALDDEQYTPAEAELKQALAVNPNDLTALSLFAASRYLQDDTPGYDAYRLRALKQNPKFGDFYFIVGELAVRHHRYADAVGLSRQAIAIDPKNGNALAALGTNLLRLGIAREPEALKAIELAFKVDPFNVRTFNTLQLYEEVISKDYETVPGEFFIYRFSKKEKPLLARYVPPLMKASWDTYVKKYGFTPKHPITVELFTERQHYGARTIGLPELGAQGTCFGELITAMSPASAEASWEEVLWHEQAHVFHLQLSNNRVARWFTEGLAEYETNVARPYWKREHNREIYLSLKRGDLWKISELSAAFTRPGRPNGVVIAYHQSSLVIHYLVEGYGFPKMVEALKLYAKGKHDAEVLSTITGKTLDQLDAEFREFLTKRYQHYAKGFLFDPGAYSNVAELKEAATSRPSDAAAQAAYAAALTKLPDEAQAQARKALGIDPKNVLAHFVLAEALQISEPKAARTEYESLLTLGTDGYQIRIGLGRLAAMGGDLEAAVQHLQEAKRWDPDRVEPYALLSQIYEAKDRRDDLLKETEASLALQEHDHDAARLLINQYAADKRWDDLIRVAPQVIGITPMEAFVHQQYGLALAIRNRPKEAIYELESALTGGVRKQGPLRGTLAKQYLAVGNKVRAKEVALQCLKDDPSNPDAKEVLQKLGAT